MTALSKLRPPIFLASLMIVAVIVLPVQAKRKPRPTQFGMLGFSGFVEPAWPNKPVEVRVAKVPQDSPVHGKLKEGDVIVGIENTKFGGDPRTPLSYAIDDAERGGGKGLSLLLKTGRKVSLELPAMGTYSPTAPWNCPKTEKIIQQTVEMLIDSIENPVSGKKKLPKYELSPTKTELLGLMATGDKKHLGLAGKLINESYMLNVDPKAVEELLAGKAIHSRLGLRGGVTAGWGWGYSLIALGEYYLLTKDESVLPAIKIFALGLARGQDAGGLWGHRMIQKNGRVAGYGQMNQPSFTNFMGMIIAKKCGIVEPVLDQAIAKTNAYVAAHIDKGGFPYGPNFPQPGTYNNNGTSGSAAICMSLMGNQHGASYFSKLSAASYNTLTQGHASSFFNPLWTPLGANLSGPKLAHEFFMGSLWYFNGKRSLKGGFPGRDNVGSFAGQALLMYCLPRKALLITGREADNSIWVDEKTAKEIAGLPSIDYAGKSIDELITLFSHPWSQVRIQAVNEIKATLNRATKARNMASFHYHKKKIISRPEMDAIIKANPDRTAVSTQQIWEAIEKGDARARITGILYFEKNKFPSEIVLPYLDKLGALLRDIAVPLDVRMAVASALGSGTFKEKAYPYYSDILRLVSEVPPENTPYDARDWKLSEALAGLCETPFENKLIEDKDLFYKVAFRFMDNKRQQVRGNGLRMLRDIPLEDFHLVADKLMYVIANKDPAYHSYSNYQETSGPGIEILANLNIKEGIDVLAELINTPGGKWGFKFKMLNGLLPKFGPEAIQHVDKFTGHPNIKKNADGWVKNITKWTEHYPEKNGVKLISLEEAKQAGMPK